MAKHQQTGFVEKLQGVVESVVDRVVDKKLKTMNLDQQIAQHVDRRLDEALGGVTFQVAKTISPVPMAKAVRKKMSNDARQGTQQTSAEADNICRVAGCGKKHRAKGYCQADYQAATKYGWPKPCPENFNPPPRRRGRPATVEQQIASRKVVGA